MSYLRSAHERAAFRRIYYPDTDVYVNKLGIRDRVLLEETERVITATRAEQSFPPRANHKSYAGFKAIHRHLFQDLYAWAGKERRYTTGRGAIPFAVPDHIASSMMALFGELASERYLVGLSKGEFARSAAHYVCEINACHPFVDGNGRAQRFWLRMLAANAGFALSLTARDNRRWNEAARIGFLQSDYSPMAKLIQARLTRLGS